MQICDSTLSNLVDVEAMDLNAVVSSKLPTSINNLESCIDIVALWRNYQIIGVTGRTKEVSLFIPDYESTHKAPMTHDVTTCDDKHTGQNYTLKFSDTLRLTAVDQNVRYRMK